MCGITKNRPKACDDGYLIQGYATLKSGYNLSMPMGQANGNIVILVMDRDDEDVQLVTSLLEKTGFQVILSPEKTDLLDSCRASHRSVQLVIIDTETRGIHMPELLDELKTAD